MTDVALIFPGQGAQAVGMGRELYDGSPEARAVFDAADALLGNDLTKVMFEGPEGKLTTTAYSQPAIVTMSIAGLRALQASEKYKNITPRFTAGLSLGEYSALIAADAFSFEDGLKLIERRSACMEEATQQSKGAMTAVIGFDRTRLEEICKETGAEVANFNSHQQIVITGHADKVAAAAEKIKQEGARNVVPLQVAGAFHSSLMQPAADAFTATLQSAPISATRIPVIANVNAAPQNDAETIRDNLSQQITASVQWVGTVEYIAGQGVTHFIEIGPGTILKGLIRKISRDFTVSTIQTPADIENLHF